MFNEIRPEHLGIHALNSFATGNSGNRAVMFGSHFSQRLITRNPTPKRIQTGVESEFGKFTFSTKMPKNGRILKVIQRHPPGASVDSLDYNPETLVIYEVEDTHEIDCIRVFNFQSYHQNFGYRNVFKPGMNQIHPNASIKEGTVFADSPGVGDNHNYMFGTELETVFATLPAVSEDGLIISESALPKLMYHMYETRKVNFGSNQYALNLYGTPDNPKPFPEIGEMTREDGLLMMFRNYDTDLAPVEMSIHDVMEPDYYFDTALYTKAGKGRIVDIQVVANNNPIKQLPETMTGQLNKYQKAKARFHRDIVDFDQQLRQSHRKKFGAQSKLRVSSELHRLIVESMAVTGYYPAGVANRHSLNLQERKEPIDEYRIEFTIEYEVTPGIGNKLTDCHGGRAN